MTHATTLEDPSQLPQLPMNCLIRRQAGHQSYAKASGLLPLASSFRNDLWGWVSQLWAARSGSMGGRAHLPSISSHSKLRSPTVALDTTPVVMTSAVIDEMRSALSSPEQGTQITGLATLPEEDTLPSPTETAATRWTQTFPNQPPHQTPKPQTPPTLYPPKITPQPPPPSPNRPSRPHRPSARRVPSQHARPSRSRPLPGCLSPTPR